MTDQCSDMQMSPYRVLPYRCGELSSVGKERAEQISSVRGRSLWPRIPHMDSTWIGDHATPQSMCQQKLFCVDSCGWPCGKCGAERPPSMRRHIEGGRSKCRTQEGSAVGHGGVHEGRPMKRARCRPVVVERICRHEVGVVPWGGCDAIPPGVAVCYSEACDFAADLYGTI